MRGIQIGLFDLLLLIGLAGIVIGYNSTNYKRQRMMDDIREMKVTANELVVHDKSLLQAKSNESDYAGVTRRDFFVPLGRPIRDKYEICFSTEVNANVPAIEKRMEVSDGIHWIDIRERKTAEGLPRVAIKIDGKSFCEFVSDNPKLRDMNKPGSLASRSQYSPDVGKGRLVLTQLIYSVKRPSSSEERVPSAPIQQKEGVLVWVQKIGPMPAAPPNPSSGISLGNKPSNGIIMEGDIDANAPNLDQLD